MIDKMNAKSYVDWMHSKFMPSLSSANTLVTSKQDHEILIGLIETYNIKSVFEFGTYHGFTSLMMWLHPNIERLKTIEVQGGEPYGSFLRKTPKEKVIMAQANTRTWIPDEKEQYDMIFIDNGHTYEEIKHDTENALKMKPKIIVWHDYPNENHPGVLKYVEEKKKTTKVFTSSGYVAWMEVKND